jgi:phage tail-like protein
VLKRGLTADKSLWKWRQSVINGSIERKSGSIVLLDGARNEVARWNFREAWPAKWEGPHFRATGNDMAIETLEIVHEGFEWA